MGDRYVVSDDNKKIVYIDANNLSGHSMSQVWPYHEIEMWHSQPDHYMNYLAEIFKTPDDADIGYFVGVDLKYSDEIKQKTTNFPFCPGNKICNKSDLSDYMKKMKPETDTQI